ncbi:unnamed protein product [Heterobilharzia americana]|nr:unnamed protein product [Heterobilharzia americana]
MLCSQHLCPETKRSLRHSTLTELSVCTKVADSAYSRLRKNQQGNCGSTDESHIPTYTEGSNSKPDNGRTSMDGSNRTTKKGELSSLRQQSNECNIHMTWSSENSSLTLLIHENIGCSECKTAG